MLKLNEDQPRLYRLFKNNKTGQWLSILQIVPQDTPGEKYLPDIAKDYKVNQLDITIFEPLKELPRDFESNSMVLPTRDKTQKELDLNDAIFKLDKIVKDNKHDADLRLALEALIKVIQNG